MKRILLLTAVLLGLATARALPLVTTDGYTNYPILRNQLEINGSDANNVMGEFVGYIMFDVNKNDNDYIIEAFYRGPETHQIKLYVDGEETSNPCTVERTTVDRVITVKAIVYYYDMVPLEAEKQITIYKLNVPLVDEIDLTFTSLSRIGDKLFDNNYDTNLVMSYAGGWVKTIVDFYSDKAFIPMGYVMTTAADARYYPNHNPKAWIIYAKANEDDEEWVPIVTVTDGTAAGLGPDGRTNYNFIIDGLNKDYKFFRFEVNDVCGKDGSDNEYTLKLAELRLCGKAKTTLTGDVNVDNSINAADVTAIYGFILNGNTTYEATSDVNNDGSINAADVTAIYKLILGN